MVFGTYNMTLDHKEMVEKYDTIWAVQTMTAKSLLSEYIQEAPESYELIKSLEKKWDLSCLRK